MKLTSTVLLLSFPIAAGANLLRGGGDPVLNDNSLILKDDDRALSQATCSGETNKAVCIQAEDYTSHQGIGNGGNGVSDTSTVIHHFDNGDWVRYLGHDFGTLGSNGRVKVRYSKGNGGNQNGVFMQIRATTANAYVRSIENVEELGEVVATIDTSNTGCWGDFNVIEVNIDRPDLLMGEVFISVVGGGGYAVGNVDWIEFPLNDNACDSLLNSACATSFDWHQGIGQHGQGNVHGNLVWYNPGDWAQYPKFDFGDTGSTSKMLVRDSKGNECSGQSIKVLASPYEVFISEGESALVSLDHLGEVVGSIPVEATGSWGHWITAEIQLDKPIFGETYISLVAENGTCYVANVDWYEIELAKPCTDASQEGLECGCNDMVCSSGLCQLECLGKPDGSACDIGNPAEKVCSNEVCTPKCAVEGCDQLDEKCAYYSCNTDSGKCDKNPRNEGEVCGKNYSVR